VIARSDLLCFIMVAAKFLGVGYDRYCMGNVGDLSNDEWATIVVNVPIVSVNLVVIHDGEVILGKRRNEPLAGAWFVSSRTVFRING